ncbi:DUF6816 family protein [Phormidesmis sp. 146-35]
MGPQDARTVRRFIYSLIFAFLYLIWSFPVQAGVLSDRVAAFPQWQSKPPIQTAQGDLIYPTWLKGTWHVTSTLVDLVAPLAPEVVTPGFESNRDYLNQPVKFDVRFVKQGSAKNRIAAALKSLQQRSRTPEVVADRAFNGLNLAKAYLGDRAVLAVKVDPESPNRQITLLRDDRQLVSIVNARAVETPALNQFITTEIFQQVFRGSSQPYLNQVETTTAYRRSEERGESEERGDRSEERRTPAISSSYPQGVVADQMTAVYLSSQDPDYFKTGERPVALYRYRLEFVPVEAVSLPSE